MVCACDIKFPHSSPHTVPQWRNVDYQRCPGPMYIGEWDSETAEKIIKRNHKEEQNFPRLTGNMCAEGIAGK